MIYSDIIIIAGGIVLGTILTNRYFYSAPLHILSLPAMWIKRKLYIRKHKTFYSTVDPNKGNILLLCHGRNHGIPVPTDNSYSILNYNFHTVDINSKVNPHYVMNVLDLPANFSNNFFDYIFLFNCPCHTIDINTHPTIIKILRDLLKKGGILSVKTPDNMKIEEFGFEILEGFSIRPMFIPRYWSYFDVVQWTYNPGRNVYDYSLVYLNKYIKRESGVESEIKCEDVSNYLICCEPQTLQCV
jgi:hypothetical protein